MSYALGRAVEELRDDIQKYKITVNVGARIIILSNGTARQYNPYTEKRVYLRELKQVIKEAKAKEAARLAAKQGSLFPEGVV